MEDNYLRADHSIKRACSAQQMPSLYAVQRTGFGGDGPSRKLEKDDDDHDAQLEVTNIG